MSLAAQNIVGAILNAPEAYWRVADKVTVLDLPVEYRAIYARLEEKIRTGEPVDAVILLEEGFEEALELAATSFSDANIEGWAQKLAEASETKRVRSAGLRIATVETYDQALGILSQVRPGQTAKIVSAKEALREVYETLKARMESGEALTGVPTGVDGLDALLGGWQKGTLNVLVGETSMGKTAMALQSAIAAAKYARERQKGRVLFFSLEMTAAELLEREIANLADFPLDWITKPAQAPDYAAASIAAGAKLALELPIAVDDRCGLTMEQITSTSTQMHMEEELVLIVVDYMHIMGRPRRNDVVELGGIATGLKNLGKTLGVPVVALHQLSRSVADNKSRRPSLFNIRASGEIAETANVVVAVYRSEIGNPDFAPLHGYAEALVLKNRQGERDVRAWMRSKLANMRLESCEPPDGFTKHITPDVTEKAEPTRQGRGFSAPKASGF